MFLIYDENDLTFVNRTGRTLDMSQINFQSSDAAASLAATRWRNSLESGHCAQVWSIQRGTPKEWPECDVTHWFVTTRNPTEHFWTELNGVTEFSFVLNGQSQITCPAALFGAEPVRCEFYLPTGLSNENSLEFLYMVYDLGQFVLINQSTDRWLPLNEVRFINFNPEVAVRGEDLTLEREAIFAPTIPGINTLLLAPGQCVQIRDPRLNRVSEPLQDCIVIGTADVAAGDGFWQAEYEIENIRVGEHRRCPAASREALTVCILPRE